jgi:glycosyltransferase involved in cell wall biosynthesis
MPSRYREPYGIVALEAAACGCVVVGSGEGGLAEAIGPCGLTFQNGDVAGLAAALKRALDDAALRERCRAAAPAHLADRTAGAMLARYERVFERTVQR